MKKSNFSVTNLICLTIAICMFCAWATERTKLTRELARKDESLRFLYQSINQRDTYLRSHTQALKRLAAVESEVKVFETLDDPGNLDVLLEAWRRRVQATAMVEDCLQKLKELSEPDGPDKAMTELQRQSIESAVTRIEELIGKAKAQEKFEGTTMAQLEDNLKFYQDMLQLLQ